MEVRREPGTVTVQNVEKQQLHNYNNISCVVLTRYQYFIKFQVSKKGKPCWQAVNTHSWVYSTTKSEYCNIVGKKISIGLYVLNNNTKTPFILIHL